MAEEIEGKLVDMLQQLEAKTAAASQGSELVLVLFMAAGDLHAIVRHFPKILPFFAWWVDIQIIVRKMLSTSEDVDMHGRARHTLLPSLGDTLAMLGHRALRNGGTSTRFSKHKSSHDAARTLVVLAGVVRKLRAGEAFTLPEKTKPESGRNVSRGRPQPAEMHPFIANIKMQKGICAAPREYRCLANGNLWAVFAAYQPLAVGRKVAHDSTGKFDKCDGNCGSCIWVSVPTKVHVERLVKDFNGKQMQRGQLVVKDTSLEGAQIALTMEEHDAKTKALKVLERANRLRSDEDGDLGLLNADF